MKIIFAGTPDIALTPLNALLASDEHDIVAVYTQPDRPAGRGRKLTPSPVKQLALSHGIPVEQVTDFKQTASIEQLKHYQADIIIVMAYGIIVPKAVLTATPFGCVNIHVSLLPRWRGAAPIQHAILAGDQITGITIMQMDEGLDTGAILTQSQCLINTNTTSVSLMADLAKLIPTQLLNTLDQIQHKTIITTQQDEQHKTYAHKIQKAQAKIDWQQPAIMIERMIRAYNPFPIAYSQLDPEIAPIRIWQARVEHETQINKQQTIQTANQPGTIVQITTDQLIIQTGKDRLAITELQLAGKKPSLIKPLLNAYHDRFSLGKLFT